jgi:hypothetical protein
VAQRVVVHAFEVGFAGELKRGAPTARGGHDLEAVLDLDAVVATEAVGEGVVGVIFGEDDEMSLIFVGAHREMSPRIMLSMR